MKRFGGEGGDGLNISSLDRTRSGIGSRLEVGRVRDGRWRREVTLGSELLGVGRRWENLGGVTKGCAVSRIEELC